MTTVRQLLDRKEHGLWSIAPDATVREAVEKIAKKDIGALLVMDGERLVGLIAERHYARNVVLKARRPSPRPVREAMDRSPVTTRPHQPLKNAWPS